jgi:hypothetical protein
MRPALTTAAAALGAALFAGAAARAQPPGQHNECFDISERETIVAADPHTVRLRVNGQVYEVKTNECPGLGRPDPRITVITNGSSFVCGRLDYSLKVGEDGVPGSSLPCVVQSQRRMTPAEVAALPRNQRP